MPAPAIPSCPNCGASMLRWSWFEWPGETHKYWYCLECDRNGRPPFIFVIFDESEAK